MISGKIAIIDYGMGNLGSIQNMLKKVGAESIIVSSPQELLKATKILLPGVGSYDNGMRQLKSSGMLDVLNQKVLSEKIPVLGICLGMQLLTESSEEGSEPGLGWIPGKVKRFDFRDIDEKLRIPHMGWNRVFPAKTSELTKDLPDEPRFYFVHSYHFECKDESDKLLTTPYGIEFTSAVQRDNIMGAQFHPEKSHKFGMKLMQNFVEM